MEKLGVRIIPINFALVEQRMKTAPDLYPDEIKEYENYFLKNYVMDDLTPPYINRMATLTAVYKHLFEEFKLDVMSAECWTATPVMFDGLAPCALYGLLNEMGYMVACESDMHCALTMVLLKSASLGKGLPLFGEFTVRHPENKNAELLWHCGPFPVSMKAEGTNARLVNQRAWLRAKDGTYTVARMDQESGNYMILPLVCHTTEGPQTHGTYLWGEFEDLQKIEDRLIDGPYIHHFVEIEGDYRREIKEFCKYFPALTPDTTIEK
jgi:L-fucose isomerase-like protein